MSNSKYLLTLQPFVINLTALGNGTHQFEAVVGKEFFEDFGNQEVLDADIKVNAVIVVKSMSAHVQAEISGSVSVPCDRCLDAVALDVDTSFEQDYVPEGVELDFGQEVYDYVCLSLPLKRVHEAGECNPEALKYLNVVEDEDDFEDGDEEFDFDDDIEDFEDDEDFEDEGDFEDDDF